jgi:hypothetical protein
VTWGAPQGADRRQLLVPVRSREHPWGSVVARDPTTGQLIRCPCGETRWTAYGQAAHHGRTCPAALVELAALAARRGRHREATAHRHHALEAVLRRTGRLGMPAAGIARVLGYTAGHTRELLRRAEAVGLAERRGRRPYRWRRRRR